MLRRVPPLLAIVVLTACATTRPAAPPTSALVSLDGDGEFVEVARSADFSRIEVRRAPPGSVASSMYTLRGVCAVLRARGAAYVTSELAPGSVPTYVLRFPATVPAAELTGPTKRAFTRADCTLLRF